MTSVYPRPVSRSCAEIGPVPVRVRSGSGSRSVHLRVEIVVCQGVWGGVHRTHHRSAITPDVRVCLGRWVVGPGVRWVCSPISAHARVVGVAHSRVLRVDENRGIMWKSNVGGGRGRLTHDIGASHLSARSTFSNEVDGATVDLVRKCLYGRVLQYASRSKTRHHRLEAAPDRSRAGLRPISRRSATDLDAEADRSRRKGRGREGAELRSGLPSRAAAGRRRRPRGAAAGRRTSRPRRAGGPPWAARPRTPPG